MKLLSRKGDEITYEARFWEAPEVAGEQGRYVLHKVNDRIVERRRVRLVNGRWVSELLGHRLANTARNVSYYSALEKALGIKWGKA